MRSLMWTSVFVLLIFELALTLILVLPVPRKIRNWICMKVSKLELKKRLKLPLTGVFFALLFALLDTTNYLSLIYNKEEREQKNQINQRENYDYYNNNINNGGAKYYHLIKEQEYKAGRNMYLVGFALTLLFVIGRITELMQEHAELEGRVENLRLAASMTESKLDAAAEEEMNTTTSTTTAANTGMTDTAPGEGIEMKPIQSKKKD